MGDLARHEGLAAPGRFVVEEDAIGGEDLVALAVVARGPVGVHLGDRVGALRLEGGQLVLGRFGAPEHLAGGGLVEAGLDPALLDGFEDSHRPQAGHIAGILGLSKLTRTCDWAAR